MSEQDKEQATDSGTTAAATEAETDSSFADGFNLDDKPETAKEEKPDKPSRISEKTDKAQEPADTKPEPKQKSDESKEPDDLESRAKKGGFVDMERDDKGKFVGKKVETAESGDTDVQQTKVNEAEESHREASTVALDATLAEYLPDEPVSINGKEVSLKEFVSEFPEVAAVARKIAEGIQTQANAEIKQIKESMDKAINALSERAFWSDVSEEHSGARKTYDSKEFQEWLGKQSPGIKRMASETGSPEDMVHLISSYKESRKSHSRKADVMSGNLQGQQRETRKSDMMNEFSEGFNSFKA